MVVGREAAFSDESERTITFVSSTSCAVSYVRTRQQWADSRKYALSVWVGDGAPIVGHGKEVGHALKPLFSGAAACAIGDRAEASVIMGDGEGGEPNRVAHSRPAHILVLLLKRRSDLFLLLGQWVLQLDRRYRVYVERTRTKQGDKRVEAAGGHQGWRRPLHAGRGVTARVVYQYGIATPEHYGGQPPQSTRDGAPAGE
ncbi:hypothetical protein C8Q80DRAFT_1266857 [Daedaleopsis nitida]|nr:hypothetical protein C8Q80DRAFT_1266857 [Daedaleopsis nitida]